MSVPVTHALSLLWIVSLSRAGARSENLFLASLDEALLREEREYVPGKPSRVRRS